MTAALPALGATAPDFTLPSTSGDKVTLSALRGKHVLLAFFPLAFTGTCTAEVCAFSEDYSQFEKAGAVVLPISVDSTASLKAFKAKENVSVNMLSDFKRDVSRLYGVLLDEQFFSQRAYFLIDRAGVLRWSFVEAKLGDRRENSQLLAELAKLG